MYLKSSERIDHLADQAKRLMSHYFQLIGGQNSDIDAEANEVVDLFKEIALESSTISLLKLKK